MSTEPKSSAPWAIGGIALAIALIFAPLAIIVSVTMSGRACAVSGAALVVDPATVPQGPIAGYNHDQLVIAAQLMVGVQQAGGDVYDQQLVVAGGMAESTLRNLDHGDAARGDTIGVIQIGPEHGAVDDRMNPTWAAQNLLKRLQAVPGYRDIEPTLALNRAQANLDPYHYRKFWTPAGEVITALAGVRPATQPTAANTSYQLGAVKPQTAALANMVGTMFGVSQIGGYRESARDPHGHPSGLALDFMVSKSQGDQIAQYLVQNGAALGVDYLIWEQRQYRISRGTWVAMEDRGNATQNHFDHVHVNVLPDADPANMSGITGACAPESTNPGPVVGGWTEPVSGGYGSPFGMRFHPVHNVNRLHAGIDMTGGGCDAPIRAARAGTVSFAGPGGGYGNKIDIDHGGGVSTRYGHMYTPDVLVRAGDVVQAGQLIGRVGSAGTSTTCHLHFEVRVNGTPVDPVPYLAAAGLQLRSYR